MKKGELKFFWSHETKRSALKRFLIVLLVFISYFIFISFKYGIKEGISVTFLTWSFFVFCTPIADAGMLLDFPIRIFTGIRMIYSEILVWITAFVLNVYMLTFREEIYDKTLILKTFKQILLNPIPFWLIIILSALGTFLSVYFADEMIDVVKHEERIKYRKHIKKLKIIIFLFIFVSVLILYDILLNRLGISIE